MSQSASLVLDILAIRARETIQPHAYGQGVAEVLQEMASLNKDTPLDFADCALAFDLLGKPKSGDEINATAMRRRTCKQLARLAGCPVGGDPGRVIRVLRRFAVQHNESDNPLFWQMSGIAERESNELESMLS